jgi:hypothetical protein
MIDNIATSNLYDKYRLICYAKYKLILPQIKYDFIRTKDIMLLPIKCLTKEDFILALKINIYKHREISKILNYMPIHLIDNDISFIIHYLSPNSIYKLKNAYKFYDTMPSLIKYNYKHIDLFELLRDYPNLMIHIVTISSFNPLLFTNNNLIIHCLKHCDKKEFLFWYYVFRGKLSVDYILMSLSKDYMLIKVLDELVPDIQKYIITMYINIICPSIIDMTSVHKTKCMLYNYQ